MSKNSNDSLPKSRSHIINDITLSFISKIDHMHPSPDEIKKITSSLLSTVNDSIELENAILIKQRQHRLLSDLEPIQIAHLILKMFYVKNIAYAGLNQDSDYDALAIYIHEGEDIGIYDSSENKLRLLIRQFNPNIRKRDIEECIFVIKDLADRVERTRDIDLVPVKNGIFNYKSKKLLPFSPNYIFTAKANVDYIKNPINPVIHNPDDNTDWDVESWMHTLSDDDEIVNLLWEIIGAFIRPTVPWGKTAWFYSELGNNGKGTLCSFIRNIIGERTCVSIPIKLFSKDFALEPLIKSNAIIVDENDVGAFIDEAANLKACATYDIININRKYKTSISYRFMGFMVQCLNEQPRVKDRSDSFYRRQIYIPFTKRFEGRERKYIKQDYLKRKEVLEYALHKVLHMNYYTLSNPESCKITLQEYKQYNDPVREFIDRFEEEFVWDALPYDFLYDLYVVWYKKYNPSGKVLAYNTFVKDLKIIIETESDIWAVNSNKKLLKNEMDAHEPLILQYQLKDWIDPNYSGSNPTMSTITTSKLSNPRIRCLMRK